MPKYKGNLNAVYISERLQECLRPIAGCALTTIVAPMGYGKTTAVNWYLEEWAKHREMTVIRVSVYSDNLAIFWKSVQEAFAHGGYGFLREYDCPADAAESSLLTDDLCHALGGKTPCCIFIDDFHLLRDARVANFLCTLANRLPPNVHLVVAGRDRFLPAEAVLRLGGRIYQIGPEQLRMNHTELAVYAGRCGVELTDRQVGQLLYTSEGWFSAVYLSLRTFSERGSLPDRESDIYGMFTAAMIDPLPPEAQEFLAVMGLADEFTVEMAKTVTGNAGADALLRSLTGQNAFVKRLPDSPNYRFHHMMKECAAHTFETLPQARRQAYLERYGRWYEEHGQYLHAMTAYRQAGDYDALLRVVQTDAGILLASLDPQRVLRGLALCPQEVLMRHPFALLVLMRCMFNWRQIPKMLELKGLLLASVEAHPEWSAEEKGDLLGECDLILSFLMYNDISAMSRLHRSASAQMSRPAISIRNSGGWTFGSPSVLMMFHRTPGQLPKELAEMDECMPHYYKITNGHGQGAETIMRAEAALLQGDFADAQIGLEQARAQIEGNGQINMTLCCEFLARRLSLWTAVEFRQTLEESRAALLRQHNIAWINILNAICAYYYALRGQTEQIPAVFAEHRLGEVHILAPGRPMIEMIENQVFLAQERYANVIGRSKPGLAVCEGMHYGLVALHLRIQTAAAYEQLGKPAEADALLAQALQEAEPDGLRVPFAETYPLLSSALNRALRGEQAAFARQVIRLGEVWLRRNAPEPAPTPRILANLTGREAQIVELMTQRLSNREIAERLYLSEGSVKQYINQIYSKLQIPGGVRNKRRALLELLRANP